MKIKLQKKQLIPENGFEGYAYNMKNQINDDEKLGSKISDEDKETIEEAIKEALEWLDDNKEASKDDFAEKQKALEAVCNPIVTKLYQESGGAGGAGGAGGEAGFDEDDDLPDHDDL